MEIYCDLPTLGGGMVGKDQWVKFLYSLDPHGGVTLPATAKNLLSDTTIKTAKKK